MDQPGPAHGRRLSSLDGPLVADLLGRCSFPPPGTEVTVAVSGGADSMALLVLSVAAGCDATAVHVDHGLRVGSAGEADQVADVAARFGAAFVARTVAVADGPNLEARAREARFSVLPDDVLTGHTADDRAESVLINLLRGAGPTGAIGIARSPRRPLLDLRRADTEALCRELAIEPVRDPSNDDPRFRRNRVRHELLPLLADIGDRDVVPIVVRQADLFASAAEVLAVEAGSLDPTSARDLAAAPHAVAGEAIRQWLLRAGIGEGYVVDGASIERVLEVARGSIRATEVAGGWRVARSGGRLSCVAPRAWQDADHG